MKKIVKWCCLSLFFSLVGCQNQSSKYESVTAEEFAKVISSPNVQRLDVRSAEEYSEGHIAGSLNIDVKQDDFIEVAKQKLKKEDTIALYCRSGRRSKMAAELLEKAGFKVVELNGGFNEWKEDHREIEK